MTMDIDEVPNNLDLISISDVAKTHVLAKLNGKQIGKLANLTTEQKEIETLLESAIVSNEGNSCLIMGPRSTGKTTLIETTLRSLHQRFSDQFITIRLSGFAQSEDKMALREITRQLDTILNQGLDEKTQKAVAMAVAAGEYTGIEQRSMSDTLRALLSSFEHASADSMSVIFILEEFDRFTMHPKQTLLYNILDLCQTAKVGIAVVGTTARMNTREMLEKRVRSRFSQRLYTIKRPNTLESFWNICRTNLFITSTEISTLFADQWNTFLEIQFQNADSPLRYLVELVFYTTKDVRQFNHYAAYAIKNASPLPNVGDFTEYLEDQRIADSQTFVDSLSELELALLICAARAEVKLESDTLNFNLVYDEYLEIAKRIREERRAAISSAEVDGYRIWSRQVARSAWEKLEAMELVVYLSSTATGKAAAAGAALDDDLKLIKVDASLLEIANMIGRLHPLFKWTRV